MPRRRATSPQDAPAASPSTLGASTSPARPGERSKARDGAGTIERRPKLGSPATWYGRVSLPSGRPWVPLGPATGPGQLSEARAREKLAAVIERGRAKGRLEEYVDELRARMAPRRGRPARTGPRTTVRELGEAWTSGELFKRHGPINGLKVKRSADVDAWRLGAHVYPHLEHKAVADVTEADVEAVMAKLPEASAAETRVRVYSLLHRLFELAIVPSRLRTTNPVSKYMRPAKGAAKLFSFLYPTELLALLACEKLPIGRRVLYALAVYTGLRKSSLFALRWSGVDLEHGTITSLVAKNDVPQMFEIDAGLVWILERWRELCGKPGADKPVVRELGKVPQVLLDAARKGGRWRPSDVSDHDLAEVLREDLRAAGVKRGDLYSEAANVQPLRFHDLRATFVTWGKRAGKGDGWIADRTGHLTPSMLARYARAARHLEDLRMVPFPDLKGAIPELVHSLSTSRRNADLGTEDDHESGPKQGVSAGVAGIVAPGVAGSNPVTHPIVSPSEGPRSGQRVDNEAPPAVGSDPVEGALAAALERASAAGEWGTVATLARELEARRTARAGVVDLDAERARRRT